MPPPNSSHGHHHPGDSAPDIPCCGLDWWIYFSASALLVLFAAAFSGLTIALMSIDPMNLAVITSSGTGAERVYASAIAPLLRDRHLLLVTLLLGNAVAAESLPIFLDTITSTHSAIMLSITLVLIFSEIIPQALFSKHKLQIGAFLASFVRSLIVLFYPVAFPIAKLLDIVLGADNPTIFRRSALKELTKAHLETEDAESHTIRGSLSMDEVRILNGTLDMADKTAIDAMRPLEETFMLDARSELNLGTLKNIMATGHSRVPVFEKSPHNVTWLLMVKDLLLVQPAERRTISAAAREVPGLLRPIQRVSHTLPLLDLLNRFSKGSARLALVVDGEDAAVGIITLEDVIEELIQEEILDETDQGVDVVAMLAHKFALQKAASDHKQVVTRGRSRRAKQILSSGQSPQHPPLRQRSATAVAVGELEEETWKPIALASLMKTRQASSPVTDSVFAGSTAVRTNVSGHRIACFADGSRRGQSEERGGTGAQV